MSAYRPVLAENGIYLIRVPVIEQRHKKDFKSVQLQPFFGEALILYHCIGFNIVFATDFIRWTENLLESVAG